MLVQDQLSKFDRKQYATITSDSAEKSSPPYPRPPAALACERALNFRGTRRHSTTRKRPSLQKNRRR